MHTLQIKSSVGLKLFHKPLHDALVLAVRATLRWSKHLRDVALYCGVLLNVSHYTCRLVRLAGMGTRSNSCTAYHCKPQVNLPTRLTNDTSHYPFSVLCAARLASMGTCSTSCTASRGSKTTIRCWRRYAASTRCESHGSHTAVSEGSCSETAWCQWSGSGYEGGVRWAVAVWNKWIRCWWRLEVQTDKV